MNDTDRIIYCSGCGERMQRPPGSTRIWVCPKHAGHHPRFDPVPPATGGTNRGGPLPGDQDNLVGKALNRVWSKRYGTRPQLDNAPGPILDSGRGK